MLHKIVKPYLFIRKRHMLFDCVNDLVCFLRRLFAMGSRTRNFSNSLSDFDGRKLLSDKKLLPDYEHQIKSKALSLLSTLEKEYVPNKRDPTVYTGTAGLSLMYYHLYKKLPNDSKRNEYMSKAVEYISMSLKHLNTSDITFLCGGGGPLAIGVVVYHESGHSTEAQQCLNSLLGMNRQTVYKSSTPDELLYGRVGFLYALLFVRHYLGDNLVDDGILVKIADAVLESGQKYAQSHNLRSPLMYEWYDTMYLGAAHGVTGIIWMLLMIKNVTVVSSQLDKIRKTVDYLMTLKFPSGNYPPAIEPHSVDELVHWCHGAPGWVYMFIAAYKTFGDAKYLHAAEECAEVVWKRGLLKKGYGLCHGVAGNAYCMLAVYKESGNERYLHRALKFAEWINDYGKHGCRIADTPYSLFEGMAGTIYFMIDILSPKEAKFPAFEL